MNINYEIEDKKLKLIIDKKINEIIFDFTIIQVIPFTNCFLVIIEPDIGVIYNENVFCVSLEGVILWRIEAVPHVYEDSPYTGMGKIGNSVKICNWDGTNLLVNPSTGEILSKSFSK